VCPTANLDRSLAMALAWTRNQTTSTAAHVVCVALGEPPARLAAANASTAVSVAAACAQTTKVIQTTVVVATLFAELVGYARLALARTFARRASISAALHVSTPKAARLIVGSVQTNAALAQTA
jgi:hypothetical protein